MHSTKVCAHVLFWTGLEVRGEPSQKIKLLQEESLTPFRSRNPAGVLASLDQDCFFLIFLFIFYRAWGLVQFAGNWIFSNGE